MPKAHGTAGVYESKWILSVVRIRVQTISSMGPNHYLVVLQTSIHLVNEMCLLIH